jgi:Family of unknown function (DUF6011)
MTPKVAATAPAEQVACRRCHRALKSLASVAAGIGPRCAAIESATEGLKPEQADKVMEVISDGGITRTAHKGVFRVVASKGDGFYLTAVTGQCSCAYGVRRSSGAAKTCFHVGAARLVAKPRKSLAKAA